MATKATKKRKSRNLTMRQKLSKRLSKRIKLITNSKAYPILQAALFSIVTSSVIVLCLIALTKPMVMECN